MDYPMFGGFTLEDEEERQAREAAAMARGPEIAALAPGRLQQQQPPPPSAAEPVRGKLTALISPRDPSMDARWRQAETTALQRSGYMGDQPYSAGEAVRDFAPMAVGGVLDVLLNKGRGLGALAGAGMQANQVEAGRRQKEAQAAGDFALSARQQREQVGDPALDAAYKQAQIENWNAQRELGWANLNERQLKQQALEVQRRLETDPTDPQALALADQIYRQTHGAIDVRGTLGAKNQGRVLPLVGRLQDLQLAEPKAAAVAVGKEKGENLAVPITADTREKLGEVPERTARDEQFTTQFAKDNEAGIKTSIALRNVMQGVEKAGSTDALGPLQRIGSQVPGVSRLLPDTSKQILQALDQAEEYYSRDQSGAAIGVKEGAKFLRQMITDPLAKGEDVLAAVKRFEQLNADYLRARASANPGAAGKVFSAAGLDLGLGGGQPGVSRETPPAGDNLGVQPQVPRQPSFRLGGGRTQAQQTPVGGQASGGSTGGAPRMRTVRDPETGETEQMELSDEDAAKLTRGGLQVN